MRICSGKCTTFFSERAVFLSVYCNFWCDLGRPIGSAWGCPGVAEVLHFHSVLRKTGRISDRKSRVAPAQPVWPGTTENVRKRWFREHFSAIAMRSFSRKCMTRLREMLYFPSVCSNFAWPWMPRRLGPGAPRNRRNAVFSQRLCAKQDGFRIANRGSHRFSQFGQGRQKT